MATTVEVSRWLSKAAENGYEYGDLTCEQVAQLLDAGLLVAPPAPPPEVTFRAEALDMGEGGIYISGIAANNATRGLGFRPGATLEVTVRQVEG